MNKWNGGSVDAVNSTFPNLPGSADSKTNSEKKGNGKDSKNLIEAKKEEEKGKEKSRIEIVVSNTNSNANSFDSNNDYSDPPPSYEEAVSQGQKNVAAAPSSNSAISTEPSLPPYSSAKTKETVEESPKREKWYCDYVLCSHYSRDPWEFLPPYTTNEAESKKFCGEYCYNLFKKSNEAKKSSPKKWSCSGCNLTYQYYSVEEMHGGWINGKAFCGSCYSSRKENDSKPDEQVLTVDKYKRKKKSKEIEIHNELLKSNKNLDVYLKELARESSKKHQDKQILAYRTYHAVVKSIEDQINLYGISDKVVNKWLGVSSWKESIRKTDSKNLNDIIDKGNKYKELIQLKYQHLNESKINAIREVQEFILNKQLTDEQISECLNTDDWIDEINKLTDAGKVREKSFEFCKEISYLKIAQNVPKLGGSNTKINKIYYTQAKTETKANRGNGTIIVLILLVTGLIGYILGSGRKSD